MGLATYHYLSRIHRFNRRDIHVVLAKKPIGKAVIFVHGFNGDPISTWNNFHGKMLGNPEFEGVDLIFYSYNSLSVQASVSGIKLCEFINKMSSNANYFLRSIENGKSQIYRRDNSFHYKKFLFVAHSLGAIVTRRALLNAYQLGHNWLNISSMVLFAPAHKGARDHQSVAKLFLPNVLSLIAGVITFWIQTLEDVDPKLINGPLKDLEEKTRLIVISGAGAFTIAKDVIWAEKESVVYNLTFLSDPDGKIIENKKHKNVCKPEYDYDDPIHYVELNL